MLPTPPTGTLPVSQIAYIHQKVSNLVVTSNADFRELLEQCLQAPNQEFRHRVITVILELIDFHDPQLLSTISHPKHAARVEFLRQLFNNTAVSTWLPAVQQRFECSTLSASISLTAIPEAFFLLLFKIFNIQLSQQLYVILQILSTPNHTGRNSLWVKEACSFLLYLFHIDIVPMLGNCQDSIIFELIYAISHCPAHFLPHRTKQRLLYTLNNRFPSIFSQVNPQVTEIFKYQPVEQPKTLSVVTNFPPLALQRTRTNLGERRLVDIIVDLGPGHLDTAEKINTLFNTFAHRAERISINELDIALVLCVVIRTQHALSTAPAYTKMDALQKQFNADNILPPMGACQLQPFNSAVPQNSGTAQQQQQQAAVIPWRLELWVQAINNLKLDWYRIFHLLDQPEITLPDPNCVETLLYIWYLAYETTSKSSQKPAAGHNSSAPGQVTERFPTELFMGLWKNKVAQLSIFKAFQSLPPQRLNFTLTPQVQVTTPIEDWPYQKQLFQSTSSQQGSYPSLAEIHKQQNSMYYTVPCVETLLSLCELETELILDSHTLTPQQVLKREFIKWPLLQKAISSCPEVLLCTLAAVRRRLSERPSTNPGGAPGSVAADPATGTSESSTEPFLTPFARELCCDLIDVLTMQFLTQSQLHLNAVAASALFKRLWADVPREFTVAMIQLHHRDRSFLMKALDIIHDLKTEAMSSLSDLRVDPFRIDFVVLAAKRQYISLETWLRKQIAVDLSYDSLQNPVHFHRSLLSYLEVNAHEHNPTIGGTTANGPGSAGGNAAGATNNTTAAAAAAGSSALVHRQTTQHTNGFVVGDTFVPSRNQYNPLTIEAAVQMFRILIKCYAGPRATEINRVLSVVHPRIRSQVPSELEKETILDTFLAHELAEKDMEIQLRIISQNHPPSYEKFILLLIETVHYLNHFPKTSYTAFFRLFAFIIRKQLVPNDLLLGRMLATVLDCLESPDDIRYTCGMDILREMSHTTQEQSRGLLLSQWLGFTKRLVSIYPVIRKNKPLVDALMKFSPTLLPHAIATGRAVSPTAAAKLNAIYTLGLNPMVVTGLLNQSWLSSYRSHLRWKRDRIEPSLQQRAVAMLSERFANLSLANVSHIAQDLLSNFDISFYPGIARFIMDFVIAMAFDPATCPPPADREAKMVLWAKLIHEMHRYQLDIEIADLTFSLVHLLLENDRACPRHLLIVHALTVLGQWVGVAYLQMGTPLKIHQLDLKSLLLEGLDNGNLYGIIPFVSTILQYGAHGDVFVYPNPYVCMLGACLHRVQEMLPVHDRNATERHLFTPPPEHTSLVTTRQLASSIDQLLNLHLSIPGTVYSQFPCEEFLLPASQRPVKPVRAHIEHVSTGPYVRIAPNKVFDIFRRISTSVEIALDTYIAVHSVQIPPTDLSYYFPDPKRFILFCLEHAIHELFASVREKFRAQVESTLNMSTVPQAERLRYCDRLVSHYIGQIPTDTLTKQFFLRSQFLVEPAAEVDVLPPSGAPPTGVVSAANPAIPPQYASLSSLPVIPITQYASIPIQVLERTAELTIQANLIAIRQRCMTFLNNLSVQELQQHNQRLQGQPQSSTIQQQPPQQQLHAQDVNPIGTTSTSTTPPPRPPGVWEQVLATVSMPARPSMEKLASTISQIVGLATAHGHGSTGPTPSAASEEQQLHSFIQSYASIVSSIVQSRIVQHDVLVRFIVCFVVEVFFLPEMKITPFMLDSIRALLSATVQHVPFPYGMTPFDPTTAPPQTHHPLTYEFTSRLLFASCEAKETERLQVFRQMVIPFFVACQLITASDVDTYLHFVFGGSPPNRLDVRFEVWIGLVFTFIAPITHSTQSSIEIDSASGPDTPALDGPIIMVTLLPKTLEDLRYTILYFSSLIRQFHTPPQWSERIKTLLPKLQQTFSEAILASARPPVALTRADISRSRFNHTTAAPNVFVSPRLASLTSDGQNKVVVRIAPPPVVSPQGIMRSYPNHSLFPPASMEAIDVKHPSGFVASAPNPATASNSKQSIANAQVDGAVTSPPHLRAWDLLRLNHEIRSKRLAHLEVALGSTPLVLTKNKADHILSQWLSLYSNAKSTNQNYQTFATTVLWTSDIFSSMSNLVYFFSCLVHTAVTAIQHHKLLSGSPSHPIAVLASQPDASSLPVHHQFASGVKLTTPNDFRLPSILMNSGVAPAMIADSVTALVLFIATHKQTPLNNLSQEQGRADDLYTNCGIFPALVDDVRLELSPFFGVDHTFATRVKILREYVFCIAEQIRYAHSSSLARHVDTATTASAGPAASHQKPSPPFFYPPSYSILLTSLLSLLHIPNTPLPSAISNAKPSGGTSSAVIDVDAAALTACERIPLFDLSNIDVLLVFHDALYCLAPVRCQGFTLAFIQCISHRAFMYRMLNFGPPYLSNHFRQLLVHTLSTTRIHLSSPVLPNACIPIGHKRIYHSLVRLFYCLQRDHTFNLSEIGLLLSLDHFIVDNATQLRNVILSSTPPHITLPPPSIPRLDLVADSFIPPPSFKDMFSMVMGLANHMFHPIYEYLKAIQNIIQQFTPSQTQKDYVVPAIPPSVLRCLLKQSGHTINPPPNLNYSATLACVLYLTHTGASQYVSYIKASAQQQPPSIPPLNILSFIRGNSGAEVLMKLFETLSPPLRHDLFSIMINFLQYPSTYTLFMSAFIQYLFLIYSRSKARYDLCHHILTTLVSRNLSRGPIPWGVQHTLISILRSQDFANLPFLHTNPTIIPKLVTLQNQLQR